MSNVALRGPSLSPIGGAPREVAVHATHGLGRSTKSVNRSRKPRQTLDRAHLPDDQWVPAKESILVDSEFLRMEATSEDDTFDRLSKSSAERFMETLQEIDAQGSASHRWSPGEWTNIAFLLMFGGFMSMCMDPSAKALADEATEAVAAAAPAAPGGVDPTEAAILILPVALYAAFTVFRKNNPQADIGNFLLGITAVVIFANILFIIFFKVRLI